LGRPQEVLDGDHQCKCRQQRRHLKSSVMFRDLQPPAMDYRL
jgi:hypothetical protein